ncbi:MAG: sulfotransferase family 2 domain-containing protein [Bacillota bacterium]
MDSIGRNTNHKKVQNKLLIFMHIPKTGGVTLANILEKHSSKYVTYNYKQGGGLLPQGVCLLKDQLKTADALGGHFFFGAHRYLSRPCTYITMLRNPIERVISEYYFIRRRPQNPIHNQVNKMSLEEYVDSNLAPGNYQTIFACGDQVPNLNNAIENLNQFFSVVGITELFDQTIHLMQKQFGWKNVGYSKMNATANRPTEDQIPKEVLKKIKSKNELDFELYFYFRKRLEKKVKRLGY